ncbi:MAG: peptidylprolyl isomerase [Endozoicomonas sp.]
MMRRFGKRLLSSPFLHCLTLGLALLYVSAEPPGAPTIMITEQLVGDLQAQWQRQNARPANSARLQQLVNNYIEEEILFREAIDRRFDQLPVVKDRLQKLGEFLKLSDGNAAEREREALKLGLLETDPLIRRYLVSAIRETLVLELAVVRPQQEEIEEYYRQHLERFRLPARARLSHVYVGGLTDTAHQRALLLQPRLTDNIDDSIALGDPFYNGHRLPLMSATQLGKRMGNRFADSVITAEPGQWTGPVASSYGYHWVYVHEAQPFGYRPLVAAENQIRSILLRKNQNIAFDEWLQGQKEKYRIENLADAGTAHPESTRS